jgi:hypothetical protein
MELVGSLEENLTAAVRSAKRLREHPVHTDTLQYWADLLHYARRSAVAEAPSQAVEQLIVQLETELAQRPS